jgi:hypothetical protein
MLRVVHAEPYEYNRREHYVTIESTPGRIARTLLRAKPYRFTVVGSGTIWHYHPEGERCANEFELVEVMKRYEFETGYTFD